MPVEQVHTSTPDRHDARTYRLHRDMEGVGYPLGCIRFVLDPQQLAPKLYNLDCNLGREA